MPMAPRPYVGALGQNPHLAGALGAGLSGGFGGRTPSPWGQINQIGTQLAARGQPRFAGQPAAPAAGGGGMEGMMGFPMGLMGLLGGGGLGGLINPMLAKAGIDPSQIPQLQGLLGPTSEMGWGAGTETIPGGTPRHWLYNLFNRGQ